MERIRPAQLSLTLVLLMAFSISCAGRLAREAARKGAHHVSTLESDLAAKANAENQYYEEIRELTIQDFDRTKKVLIQDELTRAARAFVAAHPNAKANKQLAAALQTYFNNSRGKWEQSEKKLQNTLSDVEKQLEEGHQKLSVEFAKLAQLRSKLSTLGKSRTWRDLMKFLIAYGKATKEQLDQLQKNAQDTQ